MKVLDPKEKWNETKDPRTYRQGDDIPEDEPTCIVPWTSITLSANGNIKPCCVYDSKGDDQHFNFYNGDTLEDAHKGFEWLRQAFINKEKPIQCGTCWRNESTLSNSRRSWMYQKIQKKPDSYPINTDLHLKHMDLNFGNTCNLKCRHCGSWGSTNWFKEDIKLNDINRAFKRAVNHATVRDVDPNYWIQRRHYFDGMERIDFKGGEPFMQQGHYDVLKMLIDTGNAGDVVLGYVTNGTKNPEELEELWPYFKRINLNISIETAKPGLYEYFRGGKIQTIEQLEQSVYWFDQFDNLKGDFAIAISTYSIFDLQDLADWIERVTSGSKRWKTMIANRTSDHKNRYEKPNNFNSVVSNPAYLDPNNMPPHIKQRVLDRWNKKYHNMDDLRNAMQRTNYNPEQWELFKQYTKSLDQIRGESVLDHIPELAGEL